LTQPVPGSSARWKVPRIEGVPEVRSEQPSFSVVIAAYQAAATIGAAVASALDQTIPPKEVIVCDDGSTDDIGAALAPFGDRVLLLRQPNRGPGAARNRAIAAASGEFIDFLDADDAFHPRRHAALSALAVARPDLGILVADIAFDVNGKTKGSFYASNSFPTEGQREAILRVDFLHQPLVRRDLVLREGGFDESLRVAEDWDLWMRVILGGAAAGLVDEILGRYRIHAESLSADRPRTWAARARVLNKVADDARLTPAERVAALQAASELQVMGRVASAEHALLTGAGDARRLSMDVAMDGRAPLRTRIKAAISVVAPRLAGRRLRSRGADRSRRLSRSGLVD
jgi:GT2 family glycosyltransferase